jgi:hypothetical protein
MPLPDDDRLVSCRGFVRNALLLLLPGRLGDANVAPLGVVVRRRPAAPRSRLPRRRWEGSRSRSPSRPSPSLGRRGSRADDAFAVFAAFDVVRRRRGGGRRRRDWCCRGHERRRRRLGSRATTAANPIGGAVAPRRDARPRAAAGTRRELRPHGARRAGDNRPCRAAPPSSLRIFLKRRGGETKARSVLRRR